MKVLKMSCPVKEDGEPNASLCHTQTALTNPNMLSMLHKPNNHILIDRDDYVDGHVKKTAWTKAEENKLDIEYRKEFQKIAKVEFV